MIYPGEERKKSPTVLIVVNNPEVANYLYSIFEQDNKILVASNGFEGRNKAVDFIPDLIVSDIIMPLVDGIEMLDALKNDIRTSHIPIILLTTRTKIASRIESMERAADAYLSKPINAEELKLQLKALIKKREKLWERYSDMDSPEPSPDKYFRREDQFMLSVRQIMKDNVDNEDFDIHTLCKKIGLTRSQLYRKFKALTNRTISEYFHSYRLYNAKELMLKSDLTVTEAALETGFKDLPHFNEMFTKEFGVNPDDLSNE